MVIGVFPLNYWVQECDSSDFCALLVQTSQHAERITASHLHDMWGCPTSCWGTESISATRSAHGHSHAFMGACHLSVFPPKSTLKIFYTLARQHLQTFFFRGKVNKGRINEGCDSWYQPSIPASQSRFRNCSFQSWFGMMDTGTKKKKKFRRSSVN